MTQPKPVLSPTLVLLVAVLAMSWSGPLVKFAAAPPQVVAAWRLVFSVALIALVVLARRAPAARTRIEPRDWMLAGAAGVMLALHFWTWIASLQYTTVASSVVLVSMQPIFVAALSATLLNERASPVQWVGIVLACMGAIVIGLGDAHSGGSFSPRALFGDALALVGAMFVSVYYVIGRRLRQKLDLWIYIGIVYGIAALVLIAIVLADPRAQLFGHPSSDWWVFIALAAGPMMLGHTGVNYALRYVPAYVANVAILGEPVGATLIAWLLPQLREVPSLFTLAGAVLIGTGIFLGAQRRPGKPAS